MFLILIFGAGATVVSAQVTRPDGNWWNTQLLDGKVPYVSGMFQGIRLGIFFGAFENTQALNGETAKCIVTESELGGLKWTDVELTKATVRVQRQIVTLHPEVTFGPVKNKKPRTVRITAETVGLLRRHKAHQATLKLQSGGRYHDHGLVFAKEWGDLQKPDHHVGDPLALNNIGEREFGRLIKVAGVRRIKFHGLRHTSATLALQEGNNPKVVQERLGHQKIATTLDIYAHVLPAMDQDAANAVGALIHGKR